MRDFKKNFLTLCIGCIIALVFAEILIRTFPNRFARYLYSTNIAFKQDKDVGYIGSPNQKNRYYSNDFMIYPITTNSLGFRDNEWKKQSDFSIGILGDSHMMAREVSDDSTTSFILEKIVNKEVLNSAIGGHGTVTQLEIYKKFLRRFKPNITILFFTKSNDVHDNSCELIKALHYRKTQPCGYIVDGKIVINKSFDYPEILIKQSLKECIREFVKKYFWSLVVLNRFIFEKSDAILHRDVIKERNLYYEQVHMPPTTKIWKDAWRITEKMISDLKKEVELDGSRLLIVSIPDYLEIAKITDKEFKEVNSPVKNLEKLNFVYPSQRLRDMCTKYDIALLEPKEDFQRYRDNFHLGMPYFSYWHDGHYNPVAHFLLANLVAQYLIKQRWIPLTSEEKDKLLYKINKNLDLSPVEILGKEGYRQIYNRKVYLGSSNISEILHKEY